MLAALREAIALVRINVSVRRAERLEWRRDPLPDGDRHLFAQLNALRAAQQLKGRRRYTNRT